MPECSLGPPPREIEGVDVWRRTVGLWLWWGSGPAWGIGSVANIGVDTGVPPGCDGKRDPPGGCPPPG